MMGLWCSRVLVRLFVAQHNQYVYAQRAILAWPALVWRCVIWHYQWLYCAGLELKAAALLGVSLHATVADVHAQQYGERGMLAGDVVRLIQAEVNKLAFRR